MPNNEVFESSGFHQGDLGNLSHTEHVTVINNNIEQALRRHTPEDAAGIQRIAEKLNKGILDFRKRFVDNRYAGHLREEIAKKYKAADHLSEGKSMREKIATRLAQFDNASIVSDVDNTITKGTTYLERTIPGSSLAEPLMKPPHGTRDDFPHVFAKIWRFALQHHPDLFYTGGRLDEVQIREGVDSLFSYLRQTEAKRYILSANFMPFVEGVLSKTVLADDPELTIYANTADDITPTDKGSYLKMIAQRHPKNAVIYFGDGSSDIPALDAKDVVACYFALEGSEFERELKAQKIPYLPYRDFHDIQVELKTVQAMATQHIRPTVSFPAL